MKKCFKCSEVKELSEFYKHKDMTGGYLGKCKDCTKKDTKERTDTLLKDPKWHEKEKERHREKYYRLGYKEKHKSTPEQEKIATNNYRMKYPEKYKAVTISQRVKALKEEKHHWSYNKEHYKDVIHLMKKEHTTLHRYIIYDQERMMYRDCKTGLLLDTKESHTELLKKIGR